jgi:hypothetical protein
MPDKTHCAVLGRSAMRHLQPILTGLIAATLAGGLYPSACQAQELPPPAPPTVGQPILPTGISEENVEVFGRYCYIWQELPETQVIQYEGDFSMDMGQRHLSADDAVIWIQRYKYQGRVYAALQVFLWRDAKVIEPGGTVTRGDILFATLNTFGTVATNYRVLATRSAEDTALYRRASRARQAYQETEAQLPPSPQAQPLSVLRTREPGAIRLRQPRRRVYYGAENSESEIVGDQRVVALTGDVYVFQGEAGTGDFLEIRADAAVVWLRGAQLEESLGEGLSVRPSSRPARSRDAAQPGPQPSAAAGPRGAGAMGGLGGAVSAVYLEGDVVLTLGERMVRARQLYYDFDTDQAYILDAVVRVNEPVRRVPFYVRAAQIRQLARDRYEATAARVTTDEFYTPHYHVGAEKVVVVDRTPRDAAGQVVGVEAGTIAAKDVTFNVGGVPVWWWPYTRADVRQGELALRSYRFGYSDEYGWTSASRWNLFPVLGLATPEGFNADFRLDYYSERGPGAGVEMDYKRDHYNGLLRSYYIYDQGDDTFGHLREDIPPPSENRGRFTWRHRQYLPDDWEVTLEISYLPDANFLEEYYRNEYYNGKEQESLVYVKKQRDNWAFTGLYKNRLNNFLTQSESLPDFTFYLLGEPLADNYVTTFTDARAGLVRYQPDNRRLYNSHRYIDNTGTTRVTTRTDLREEADVPIDLGPVRLVPFGVVRGTWWDQTEVDPDRGALLRGFFDYGVRSSAYAWKIFEDVESRMLDLHRLRHVAKSEATFWFADANEDSRDLTPFTHGVEDIDPFDGFTYRLRNLWQTQRGGPGRWRSVDWLTVDLTAACFNNPPRNRLITGGDLLQFRPENSIPRSFLEPKIMYRLSDTTLLTYDANYDVDDGEIAVQNAALAVERDPRLSYFIGWQRIKPERSSNLLGFGANYKATEVHTFAIREFFDIARDKSEDFTITYIRKLPRWYAALTFQLDNIQEEVGMSLSVWPEGIPEATLGGRKYTGIPEHIGITP